MFQRENRTLWDNVQLGGIFVFLGGYTGVLTSLILGHFVNCMTGNSTETGMSLGHFDFHEASMFGFIVMSFIFGAFLSTKTLDSKKNGHVVILIAEAILLVLVGIVPITPALFMAAGAMGLQNGLTTYTTWTSGKVRSTHVTGTSTDIGVSLANGDMREFGFTTFQALTYLGGTVSGFFVAQSLGKPAFALGSVAILIILFVDSVGSSLERKVLT